MVGTAEHRKRIDMNTKTEELLARKHEAEEIIVAECARFKEDTGLSVCEIHVKEENIRFGTPQMNTVAEIQVSILG